MAVKHTVVCTTCDKEENLGRTFRLCQWQYRDGKVDVGIEFLPPDGWTTASRMAVNGKRLGFDFCSDECVVAFYSAEDTTDCAPDEATADA